MTPEAAEAVRIADKHLAGESIEKRKALALDILEAIVSYGERVAIAAIKCAVNGAQKNGGDDEPRH
jgi:hypothetical protein